ncbi:type VII secretion integral membrane protein EccD [Motilibacter rhizosphaerae]|uniref:Type VII secretion integral membrane protein EccD n=1 Tax=Motilibacter rhizosphaerae TaxID=598652 RepID=A0A4Q7NTH0_9ACTN|nr:type VII secretion integral membrane protein EccD [Motilibacter rhizosphaerae]RZS90375.1 type VII secretion integral membrane protein EccD [Motilibacter rhizosphaerae]
MAISDTAGLTRVTVVAPHTRVDLALPHAATVAELLVPLLRVTGEDLSSPALPDAPWTLSRFGAPALDPGRSIESHGVRDGEVLYLAPAPQAAPPPVFDDVVDAVATASGDPHRRWSSLSTRTAGLLCALAALLAGALVGVLAVGHGSPSTATAVSTTAACGGAALVLLVLAALVARAYADTLGAAVASSGAVAYAAATGVCAVVLAGSAATGREALAAGGGLALLAVVLGLLAVGDFAAAHLGAALAALGAAAAGAGAVASGSRPEDVAAVVAPVALALQAVLPALALRLARLPLPRLPADLTGQARDDEALAGVDALVRSRLAAEVLSALLLGSAAVTAAAGAVLALDGGTAARWLAGVLAAALLLRTRTHPARLERAGLLVAGLVPAAALVGVLVAGASGPVRAAAALPALGVVGLVVLLATLGGTGREPSPYWWRLLDLLEVVALVAVVPVALAVPGTYGYLHGLGG